MRGISDNIYGNISQNKIETEIRKFLSVSKENFLHFKAGKKFQLEEKHNFSQKQEILA